MKKTKLVVCMVVALVTMGAMSMSVSAHGGCHGQGAKTKQQQNRHAVCAVKNCELQTLHAHSGTWYCGNGVHDDSYGACTVAGCVQLGLHEHDGDYYYCASHGDGHGCARRNLG